MCVLPLYALISSPWLCVPLFSTLFYSIYRIMRHFLLTRCKSPLIIRDKTVLITGASSGLGRALAVRFYKGPSIYVVGLKKQFKIAGAHLILAARNLEQLHELGAQLVEIGSNPHLPIAAYLDLADPTSIAQFVNSISLKSIDILINNAGQSMRGSCTETDIEVQRRIFEVNYFGTIQLTTSLMSRIPLNGVIVVIGSVQSRIAVPFRSAYSASKHALQFANYKGYIKLNQSKLMKDMQRIRRTLKLGFNGNSNDLPGEREMIQFLKENSYLFGGFIAGIMIGIGLA